MKKILIVEDEVDLARALQMRIADWKYETVLAIDAYEGTKLAMEQMPDLIILDLMLPAGGGVSTLKNIRNSSKVRFIPVIILTGMKDEAVKNRVIELGVSAYMEKPFKDEELKSAIDKCLQNSAELSQ